MKKSLMIILLIAIILYITATCVLADNAPISLEGETSVAPGSTGTITVKVSSNDTIGVVSGFIGYDSNITSIQVSGKNNWTVTYNSETGKFNAYKAEGGTSEEIIQITYTASSIEGTATITLSSLQVTNIDYETENASDLTKSISIENSTVDEPADDPTDDPTDNPTDDPTDNPADDPTDDPADNPTDNTNKPNNGTSNKNSSTSTLTTATKTLPYAGVVQKVVLPMSVILLGIVGVGTYFGYRKYRGIK